MRIGLSGPLQGHKNTLLKSVKESIKFRSYEFDGIEDIMRTDISNREQTLHKQVYNLFMKSHIVTTYTTFDAIVYSKFLLDNKCISDDFYLEVGKAWLNTMELYNVIFYLPPEDDEVLTDEQAELWSLFDRAIYKYDVPVIPLNGSADERKKEFIKVFI